MDFDGTGKVTLDHIYTQPDPRPYFSTLRELEYCIPELAKPHFDALITDYRAVRGVRTPTVLDIGCSYGINAALHNQNASMEQLTARYCGAEARAHTRGSLLARDRRTTVVADASARFVGLDSSTAALDYATAAGYLDDAVYADLEAGDPTAAQREQLRAADLVISTGCLGYVTEKTITRIMHAQDGRLPWMAHFVLRMFPFDPVADSLAAWGYQTTHLDRVFKQRRFASPREQSLMLDTLSTVGVDPTGLESEGWLYAQLYVSRPGDEASRAIVDLATSTATARSPQPPTSRMTLSTNENWSEKTFGNEDRLPRVPLPTLEDTCERFVEWCTPLLTADELASTRESVTDLLREDGPARRLHADLERYDSAAGVHSWLDDFWPSRYLGRRDRIALNANFFFLFQDSELGQVERAAALITGAVDYKTQLDSEAVPPIIQRGQPLSMEQNKFLFSTTRIPGAEQDAVRAPYTEQQPGPSQARHIVVFFRGNMFRLDVIGPDGVPHATQDLEAGLHSVMKAGATRVLPESAVGNFTTKARAEWAASRAALLACDPGNADALYEVESALFCLTLDDTRPSDIQQACDQLLHGDSSSRWFDKSVSLVVFDDGRAGINVEHCGLDGTTILSFVDAILGDTSERHEHRSGAVAQGLPVVEPIEFVLDESLKADAQAAAESFADYASNTATTTVSFEDFGSNRAKQLGMSPDSFVQMAYQLAHKRSKGFVGATYESIATRQFNRGRTEAMRVVTPEILSFAEAMDDPAADAATRREAFRAAASKHVQRAKQCQAGEAPEQHLWELQLIQQRRGDSLGATEPMSVFDSPGWTIMRDDYLSTSSAPSVNIQYFGFGSTSSRCIGVAYVLLPDRFNLYLSTPKSVSDEMYVFAGKLAEAVRELQELLAAEQSAG